MAPGFSFPPPPPPPPRAALPDYRNDATQDYDQNNRGGRGGRGNSRGRDGQHSRGGHQQQRDQQFSRPENNQRTSVLGGNHYQRNPRPQGLYSYPSDRHPPAQDASHEQRPFSQKRKRDSTVTEPPSGSWKQGQGSSQPYTPHPMQKPVSKPKSEVPPSVPSFGAPLFSPPKPFLPAHPVPDPTIVRPDQRRPVRLGLVPGAQLDASESESNDDEEEDDEDEEAAFKNSNTEALTFEYNGVVAKLTSQSDIKAWILERKKLWPSRQRLEEKKAEIHERMEERRRIEAETRALRSGRPMRNLQQTEDAGLQSSSHHQGSGAGLVADSTAPHASNANLIPTYSSDSDSDAAPAAESSKLIPTTPAIMQPPQRNTCANFSAKGYCRYGAKCHYQHVGPAKQDPRARKEPEAPARKTLFDRLVDQERDEEEVLALQAIKYLGDLGFFRQIAAVPAGGQ